MNSAISRPSRLHRPGARIGMIELDVEALFETQAEKAVRRMERRLDHPVELQIGLDLALVEIELGLAPLLGVIAPVPGRDFEIAALAGDDRLQRRLLPLRAQNARLPYRLQQVERRLGRLRHRVGKAEMGEAVVAQKARALGAQAAPSRRRWRDCRSRRRSRRARPRRERLFRADRAAPKIAGTARCSSATA